MGKAGSTLNGLAWTVAAGMLGLAGCAAPAPVEPFRHAFDFSRGTFAPTRVTINRNLPLPAHYLDRLDAVVEALDRSGVFAGFGPDTPSNTVLDLTLERLSDDSFNSVSASAGSVHRHGGLGVGAAVPVTGGRHTHRLTAVVYRQGISRAAYRYVGDFETSWGLMRPDTLAIGGPEHTLIANLVNRLVRDLDRDDAIPRAGGVETLQ